MGIRCGGGEAAFGEGATRLSVENRADVSYRVGRVDLEGIRGNFIRGEEGVFEDGGEGAFRGGGHEAIGG